MGVLRDGVWHDVWYDTESNDGAFIREDAQLRNWITPDGSPGPTGRGGFRAARGRYHLYVSLACPWAHRTLIVRSLKGLNDFIDVSIVHPDMMDNGWEFKKGPDSSGDRLYASSYAHELYTRSNSNYSGRVTVPILWDCEQETIVSNESSEIIRMLNTAFDELTGSTLDLYPESLRSRIDPINERVYETINNGVYRCGFSTSQAAYEQSFEALFDSLDWCEEILSDQRYLASTRITEADWRLFTTLVRFDAVYFAHFKCNRRRIRDYPNLSNYVRDLYQQEGIAEDVNFEHIKRHYYYSHPSINPSRIVPLGPDLNFNEPHNRARFNLGGRRS